jgi:hypothetical protein
VCGSGNQSGEVLALFELIDGVHPRAEQLGGITTPIIISVEVESIDKFPYSLEYTHACGLIWSGSTLLCLSARLEPFFRPAVIMGVFA